MKTFVLFWKNGTTENASGFNLIDACLRKSQGSFDLKKLAKYEEDGVCVHFAN